MRLLQDCLHSGVLYHFDPASDSILPAPAGAYRDEMSTPIQGELQPLAEGWFAFFHDGTQLVVWTPETRSIPLTPDVTAAWEADRPANKKHLSLERAGRTLCELWYTDPVYPPMSVDFTAAQEEDFDLPLLVAAVLNAPEEQRALERRWR
jgi:hypothetical protein